MNLIRRSSLFISVLVLLAMLAGCAETQEGRTTQAQGAGLGALLGAAVRSWHWRGGRRWTRRGHWSSDRRSDRRRGWFCLRHTRRESKSEIRASGRLVGRVHRERAGL